MHIQKKTTTYVRIQSTALSRRGKELRIMFTLTAKTSVMETKKTDECVVFLSSEHVIVKIPYLTIVELINELK